jgi:hypothetical protein
MLIIRRSYSRMAGLPFYLMVLTSLSGAVTSDQT